ncbi:MAG TPA: hypothetical protein VL335_00835 [Candidatus Paceibacterota bacterium]|jgi:hypothetical protein|nr:hypothetical protein [Candidatus Paceibacterota bacterium]
MNTYSLNQNPIPQVPMTAEEHHRFINMSIIAVAIAIIVGILYWWSTMNNSLEQAAPTETDLRAQVAAILRTAPVHVSQQEIDHVAAQLSSTKVSVSDAEKQAVANALRAN